MNGYAQGYSPGPDGCLIDPEPHMHLSCSCGHQWAARLDTRPVDLARALALHARYVHGPLSPRPSNWDRLD